MISRARGTAFGGIAILAWSSYGVLMSANKVTPPLLSVAIIFTSAALTLMIWRLLRGEGVSGLLPIPLATLALGFSGLFVSNLAYPVALGLGGEPVTVNIASLSWPVFMTLFIVLFRVARATWLDGVAMVVGFAGVILLATGGRSLALDVAIMPAIAGAVCWAAMSALRTRVPAGPNDAMLHFVAASGAVSWALVPVFGGVMMPPSGELLRLVLVGVVSVGLANHLWDMATRYGDPVLLAGMSFLEPVASTALIAIILSRPVGWSDGAALALVLGAVALSLMSERLRRRPASRQPAG